METTSNRAGRREWIGLAVIGVLACFWGMQLWYILLPLLAGVFGFYIGARALQEWLGTGFLATTFSWLFGIILAFAFAGLSWWFWSLGMAFVAAAAGESRSTRRRIRRAPVRDTSGPPAASASPAVIADGRT